jgi:hypothetical protein
MLNQNKPTSLNSVGNVTKHKCSALLGASSNSSIPSSRPLASQVEHFGKTWNAYVMSTGFYARYLRASGNKAATTQEFVHRLERFFTADFVQVSICETIVCFLSQQGVGDEAGWFFDPELVPRMPAQTFLQFLTKVTEHHQEKKSGHGKDGKLAQSTVFQQQVWVCNLLLTLLEGVVCRSDPQLISSLRKSILDQRSSFSRSYTAYCIHEDLFKRAAAMPLFGDYYAWVANLQTHLLLASQLVWENFVQNVLLTPGCGIPTVLSQASFASWLSLPVVEEFFLSPSRAKDLVSLTLICVAKVVGFGRNQLFARDNLFVDNLTKAHWTLQSGCVAVLVRESNRKFYFIIVHDKKAGAGRAVRAAPLPDWCTPVLVLFYLYRRVLKSFALQNGYSLSTDALDLDSVQLVPKSNRGDGVETFSCLLSQNYGLFPAAQHNAALSLCSAFPHSDMYTIVKLFSQKFMLQELPTSVKDATALRTHEIQRLDSVQMHLGKDPIFAPFEGMGPAGVVVGRHTADVQKLHYEKHKGLDDGVLMTTFISHLDGVHVGPVTTPLQDERALVERFQPVFASSATSLDLPRLIEEAQSVDTLLVPGLASISHSHLVSDPQNNYLPLSIAYGANSNLSLSSPILDLVVVGEPLSQFLQTESDFMASRAFQGQSQTCVLVHPPVLTFALVSGNVDLLLSRPVVPALTGVQYSCRCCGSALEKTSVPVGDCFCVTDDLGTVALKDKYSLPGGLLFSTTCSDFILGKVSDMGGSYDALSIPFIGCPVAIHPSQSTCKRLLLPETMFSAVPSCTCFLNVSHVSADKEVRSNLGWK